MLITKKLYLVIFIVVTAMTFNTSARTQEVPEEIIDTIDFQENLLDSNEVYKKQFDSLSNDGEWLKTKKSDLIRDLENIAEEDLDFDYEEDDFVYVWRPYGINSYWNPYYNGSWIFTSYGWMWNSYYSWGWGPYNYGRWFFSSFYGWTWFPGNVWAPNWVTWRSCNNYVGWYPTCPRVYWSGAGNRIYTNRLFTSVPRNWVFVDKKDFTKKIDNTTTVSVEKNAEMLKTSKKIKTAVYVDPSSPKIKYTGPDMKVISKESGEKIIPEQVIVTKSANSRNEHVKISNITDIKENGNTQIQNNNSTTKEPVTKTRDNTTKTKPPVTNTGENNVKKKSRVPESGNDNTNTKSRVTKPGNNKTKTKSQDTKSEGTDSKTKKKKLNSKQLSIDEYYGDTNPSAEKHALEVSKQKEETKLKETDKVNTESEENINSKSNSVTKVPMQMDTRNK